VQVLALLLIRSLIQFYDPSLGVWLEQQSRDFAAEVQL
jgi:hypothetical protein